MGELLEETGEAKRLAGEAAGLIKGHAAGMSDQRDIQAAREEVPPATKGQE